MNEKKKMTNDSLCGDCGKMLQFCIRRKRLVKNIILYRAHIIYAYNKYFGKNIL